MAATPMAMRHPVASGVELSELVEKGGCSLTLTSLFFKIVALKLQLVFRLVGYRR